MVGRKVSEARRQVRRNRRVQGFEEKEKSQTWIGRGGPTAWPPRSPDLTPLDFFSFWGYIKDIVYKTVVADLEDLLRRIVAACATVTPEMLRNTWQELEYCLDICRATRVPLSIPANSISIHQLFGELLNFLTSALTLNTLLYADDQVIISNSEDNLQRGLYTLNEILKDFGMEISAQKSKVMAFLGQDPVRSKIIHNNQCLEQVQNFNYLGCEISYQNEKDVNKKITKFTQILGIINNTLKAKLVQNSTRIKIYNTLALPTLLYGSEIWTLKKKDMNRIKATEMKFFRRTAGYTLLDRKRNEEILEQLEVESVEEKITRYKFNWLDHVRRMENSRIPKIMMQYKPRGHRRPGRPLRRLLDGAETGLQRPNS
ncbi:hypothetical protein ANN_22927 [Periplaneta americana]|uniref:Reverse transcriptase domain-containing protein n=1 Tax=Periplaneta americana TaxID=6978 RepID=A0ABQ8SJN6_PERAM|nr:hypothetical protein ANN_22927 [Periplaneta americana]